MTTNKTYKFILSGGGTGGHIFPAIAIANELKKAYPNAAFLFVGAQDRMEMEKVPQAGYPIKGLWISGLQRSLSLKNALFPIKLISSLIKSNKILKQFKPDVAIGTGGFASAPLLKMAASKKIPCLIQEQNSYAGITNKWLSKQVNTICVAYEGMEAFFPKEKLKLTGNPVRQDLLNIDLKREEALTFFNLNPNKKTLLVIGGSLGAKTINELIAKNLPFFNEQNIQVIWQCGSYYKNTYVSKSNENTQVHPFLKQMDLAYAASDFIISRAGAISVSELCIVGKPVIFIPSPNVAEDHQTKNAMALAKKEAAIILKENELETSFKPTFLELIKDTEKQQKLADNIKNLAKPEATLKIVEEIKKLIGE